MSNSSNFFIFLCAVFLFSSQSVHGGLFDNIFGGGGGNNAATTTTTTTTTTPAPTTATTLATTAATTASSNIALPFGMDILGTFRLTLLPHNLQIALTNFTDEIGMLMAEKAQLPGNAAGILESGGNAFVDATKPPMAVFKVATSPELQSFTSALMSRGANFISSATKVVQLLGGIFL